jgi:hypothetical protein
MSNSPAIDQSKIEMFTSVMQPDFRHDGDLGWEECVDLATCQLLRTILAKSEKDASGTFLHKPARLIHPVSLPPLTLPSDGTKFKKHIMLLLERMKRIN